MSLLAHFVFYKCPHLTASNIFFCMDVEEGRGFFLSGENNFFQISLCLCSLPEHSGGVHFSRNKAGSGWNYPCYIYIMKWCLIRILIQIWTNWRKKKLLVLLLQRPLTQQTFLIFFFVCLHSYYTVWDMNGYWNQKMVKVLSFELSYDSGKNKE